MARCCRYSPEDPNSYFPPGLTFQPNWKAVSTGLIFVSISFTQSEPALPIMIENNKNHKLTLPKKRNRIFSPDVTNKEEPKSHFRKLYELTNPITTTDIKYKDCFLLHSTILAQSSNDSLNIVHENENSMMEQPNSTGHCISADYKWGRRFAELLSKRILAFEMPADEHDCQQCKFLLSGA